MRKQIDARVSECWLSPVSIWELGVLQRRERVELPDDYHRWLALARTRLPWREAPLNSEVALASVEVDVDTADPADRFLAATAQVFELELATVDQTLIAAEWLPTVSG